MLVLALLLLAVNAVAASHPDALRAAWAPVRAGESAAAALARSDFRDFDPARFRRIARGHHGAWVRLRFAGERWPASKERYLVLSSPGLSPATLFVPGRAPSHASIPMPAAGQPRALDRLVFRLPSTWPGSGALMLRLDAYDGPPSLMTFSIQHAASLRRADMRRTVLVTAAFAVMLVTALIALAFAVMLRDSTFLLYAVYVSAYAVLQAEQSGYLFYPLGLHSLASDPALIGRLTGGISGAVAMFFFDRLVGLRTLAPRWHRLVRIGGAGILLMAGLAATDIDFVVRLLRLLINPWLILCTALMLAAAILAGWRGSRYAWYFLLGWTPLLLVTALGSAQLAGAFPAWTDLDLWAIGAGAFEALLLSLGLADRALALRHDRDEALRQAQTDELTQLPNRRAWVSQLRQLMEVARRHRRPLAVLFLDLDHFKRLNDALGHQAGDRALMALANEMRNVLQPGDVIGRYGGEEFTVALLDCSRDYAAWVAERLRARLEHACLTGDAAAPPVSASIGVAMMQTGESLDSLLGRADLAMYGAKMGGRNQVRFAT